MNGGDMHASTTLWNLIETLQEGGLSDAEVVATVKGVLHEAGRLVSRRAQHRGFSVGTRCPSLAPRGSRGAGMALSSTPA
jgi:hypothetical protein